MKSGFKQPMAEKSEKPKEQNLDKAPWAHSNVPYDERTSCYVSAGTNYGTGHAQPVGHDGATKKTVDALPMGRVNTKSLYHNE